MTFKQIIAIACTTLGLGAQATAQNFVETGITYPLSTDGDKYVVTGFINPGMADEAIYANALLWTIENVCPTRLEGISENNVQEKRFSFGLTLEAPAESENKNRYHCQVILQAAGGKLVYHLSDIQIEGNSFISKKITPMEKLSPEKKASHKETMNDFVKMESLTLNKLFDFVTTHRTAPITHWKEISIRKPVKGMTEDECRLAFGKPQNITESGGEVQWMYSTSFYLFFKQGKVETIIK